MNQLEKDLAELEKELDLGAWDDLHGASLICSNLHMHLAEALLMFTVLVPTSTQGYSLFTYVMLVTKPVPITFLEHQNALPTR